MKQIILLMIILLLQGCFSLRLSDHLLKKVEYYEGQKAAKDFEIYLDQQSIYPTSGVERVINLACQYEPTFQVLTPKDYSGLMNLTYYSEFLIKNLTEGKNYQKINTDILLIEGIKFKCSHKLKYFS